MKRHCIFIVLLMLVFSSCRSTIVEEIERARIERESVVIFAAREYFLDAGGYLEEFPELFNPSSDWLIRIDQARAVLVSLGKDETIPPSLIHRITLYLALMLTEASIKEPL